MQLSIPLAFSALIALVSATSATTPSPATTPETPHQTGTPTLVTLENRGRVDGPAHAMPTDQMQKSPVMTINVNGEQVVYTQKFSDVPDQWPTPKVGAIGFGTLGGKARETGTKTADKRDEMPVETGTALVRRCRTWGCRRLLEGDDASME